MTSRLAGIRLVAFDLDGTLVDSAPDLCHCLGEALASVGLPRPTEDETRSWIGDGVEALVERGLEHKAAQHSGPALPFGAAYSEFLRCYAQNLFVRTKCYPGVAETLDALRNRGLRLCCITNKRMMFSLEVLDRAGIRDRFELVLGGDSLPEKKPSPTQLHAAAEILGIDSRAEPRACILVGDSVNDYSAARAAGWRFVWAAYGYGRRLPGEPDRHDADRTRPIGAGTPGEAEPSPCAPRSADVDVDRIDSIGNLLTMLPSDPRSP